MEISLDRLRYHTVGLIKDAIAWTPAPLDDKMKTTLVDCLRIAQSETFEEDDFMRVRGLLNEGGLYTSPQMEEEDEEAEHLPTAMWRVLGHMSDTDPMSDPDPFSPGTAIFVNARTSLEAVAAARARGMEGVSSTTLVSEGPQHVKKYRIINLASNAEWEADTSEQVWDIIGKEIPLFGIYEVRDNLTNEIVPEFIPL